MSDLYTIFSPAGEKFEVTLPNFRDLSTEAGWSVSPTALAAATTVAPTAPVPVINLPKDVEDTDDADETATDEVAETETPERRLTVEDFDDLTEKADVFAYIEATFPGNKIDGRANRDKLITIAIELATAE